MNRISFALVIAACLGPAIVAEAGKPSGFQVKPWIYDPFDLGTAEAEWVTHEGLPEGRSPSYDGGSSRPLRLASPKNGLTALRADHRSCPGTHYRRIPTVGAAMAKSPQRLGPKSPTDQAARRAWIAACPIRKLNASSAPPA